MVGSITVIQDRLRHSDISELIEIVRPPDIGGNLDCLKEREPAKGDEYQIKTKALPIFPCGLPKPNHVSIPLCGNLLD